MVHRFNKLNELEAKEWLKFTKTWFIHNPKKRKKNEILHPAKYPESLIEEFILFFTKQGGLVIDPFLGTGSTLVAAHTTKRNGIGVELQEKYADIAKERISNLDTNETTQSVVLGDSKKISQLIDSKADLIITSPPYGPMLHKKGFVSKKRSKDGLDQIYSDDSDDLGNVKEYGEFISQLADIFKECKHLMKPKAHLVVIIQNYMNGGEYRTLAWDLATALKPYFTLRGERLWLQDNKTLFPYGYRYAFVPNVHHHYCLIFRNDLEETK